MVKITPVSKDSNKSGELSGFSLEVQSYRYDVMMATLGKYKLIRGASQKKWQIRSLFVFEK